MKHEMQIMDTNEGENLVERNQLVNLGSE